MFGMNLSPGKSRGVKIASLLASIAMGVTMIMNGQTEAGIGIITAALSSTSALTKEGA